MPLPSREQIHRAVDLYLERAYASRPKDIDSRLPHTDDIAAFLMGRAVERDPGNAPLDQVRSFSLRLGNERYPHMKLRLSRPPRSELFVFSVDAHDAFLHAPKESADYEPLEALKRHNAALADAISTAWEAAGLLTERSYLRQKIQEAREKRGL